MKKLILFAASNFGDEIVQMFRDINAGPLGQQWEIAGFLDDNHAMIGKSRNGIQVLGTRDWLESNPINEYWFVCCVGNPVAKKKVVEFLISKGVKFATGIHPSVIISPTTTVGEGTVITAGNILTTNIQVGNHIIINLACSIGHFSQIGDYCTINPGANISGDVILEEGILVGTNAAILEKIQVGAFSKIGAGAVVTKDIPEGVTAVGVPAKVINK